jgi:hypothetical protein
MPVADQRVSEGVDETGAGQSITNKGILIDIVAVVVVKKVVVNCSAENQEGDRDQTEAKRDSNSGI